MTFLSLKVFNQSIIFFKYVSELIMIMQNKDKDVHRT